jgi:3',5'-cyclic AMP phosphodiesterase CpdA
MTRIVLLADLHFGSVPIGLADRLCQAIAKLIPDVIVVAGDLTLRSRSAEFAEVKAWLATLPAPLMLLPGNHDLPFWNMFERFASPFARYAKATGAPLMPVFEDSECFVLGLNTTASWQPHMKWQEGMARRGDVAAAEKLLAAAPSEKLRIVATHHPLFKVEGLPRARPVRRFALVLNMLGRQRVEMLMHGHLHQQYASPMRHGACRFLSIGAPTALSSRVRGEPNGFWLIEAGSGGFVLTLHRLDEAGGFIAGDPVTIAREPAEPGC